MGKTVYLLGAGCSKEDKAPLVNEFFDVAFNKVEPGLDSEDKARFEKVKEFRDKELPKANIEELLSYIDTEKILETRPRTFNLEEIRLHLISLIIKTLKEQMGSDVSFHYSKFREQWIEVDHQDGNEPIIISFNWDIALDRVLIFHSPVVPEGMVRPNLEFDYGSNFKPFTNDCKPKIGDTEESYKLIKLHGSLNWLSCEKCKNKYFLEDKILRLPSDGFSKKCPNCGNQLLPILIPPTFNKLDMLPMLKDLWSSAFKAVEEAERIFIIGYSFPEDDVHFKLFFRSALFANYMKNKKPILIDIVNYKKYLNEKTEFEAHYKKMIEAPGAEVRPNFHYLKFSEFANGHLGEIFENSET